MATLKTLQAATPEKNAYIHIQDYNKLKLKYENKTEENKKSVIEMRQTRKMGNQPRTLKTR